MRNPAVLWRTTVSGGLMITPHSSEELLLDLTGAEIWRRLEAPMTVQRLVQALASQFQLDGMSVWSDIKPFLEALTDRGALVVTRASPT
jgi:hypothetical protein